MNKYHAGIVLGISLLVFGVFAKYLDEYCLGGLIAFAGCIAYLILDSRYKDSVRLDVIRETEQELIVKGSGGVFVFNRQGEASHFAHRVGAWLGRDVESDA